MNIEFKELGLDSKVLKSISDLGFTKPSKIQELMIPLIMNGHDLIGQAQTGTGKTLAYAASILSKMSVEGNIVKAIILVPTRELAIQVTEEFKTLNTSSNFDILAVFGGSDIDAQIKALRRGVDVVVGTPGRVLDLMRRGRLNVNNVEFFVLDEADEMLDMGFLEDIKLVFDETKKDKQVLMLSATMPKEIKLLASKYMKKDYQHVLVESNSKTAEHIDQYYYLITDKFRVEVICRVLDLKSSKRTIIFCETKRECDELLTNLSIRGYSAEAMHGDIAQAMRIKTLDRFKKGAFKVLIATDVAARGIHIDEIECVINYKLPQDFESYIHRIGRTGRAGAAGEAITLATSRDLRYLESIAKFANCKIPKRELPAIEEIVKLKYQNTINRALEVNENEAALEYVRDLNKADLINLAASLLKITVDKELGSNLDQQVVIRDDNDRVRGVREGYTRVFVNIGSKDNVKKGSLLDYIKDETRIDKDHFKNIEVLSTFTFIDITNSQVDTFKSKIQNKKWAGRTIRVENAKRQK